MTRLAAVFFVLALPIHAEVIELPRATLAELACAPAIIPTPSHEHRHRHVAQTLLSVPAATSEAQTGVSVLQAPQLGTNFFSASSRAISPADAAGAAGPHNIVSAFNSGLYVYDRSGNPLSNVSLPQFWSDPSITSGLYYDPRILYDRFADRWFVVALYDNNFKNSTVVVGVSANGDPNGSWSRYRISVGSDIADFTRLGMSADRFIITANGATAGTLFWSVTKTDAYSTLTNVQTATSFDTDFMPVTIVDNSTTTAYLVTNNSSGSAALWRLDSGANKPSFIATYSTAPWAELFNTEIGPEAGGQRMDVGDTTMQAAVGRGGVIWAAHSIVSTTAPVHTGIRWWRIPMNGSAAETGTIDDPTAATFYAFPGIAVNRIGGALISYSLFAATRFPTAAYAYRDPSGAMSSTGILKEGETPPLDARWGDYTTAVVDPANDLDFWTVQSYGNSQLWATWWGEIRIPAPPARSRAVRH